MKHLMVIFVLIQMFTASSLSFADQTDPRLDELFGQLRSSDNYQDAARIEQVIWEIWTVRGVPDIDQAMAYGIAAMNMGRLITSVKTFDYVIKLAPEFAEGWNKRATVYYMLGRFDDSVRDIQQTLELEPRHFGALSGMGLIYDNLGKFPAAANIWEKALHIHPHMPGIRERVDEIREDAKGKQI
jgi:tetratricopeptide (TPR) repeat protein